jgi:hypothetical protein
MTQVAPCYNYKVWHFHALRSRPDMFPRRRVSFKNLYPNLSHFGLEVLSLAFHGGPCVANPAVTPSAVPCRKSARWRFIVAVAVVFAVIAVGVASMEGDSQIALLIGVAPFLLVALVCLCSPCVKQRDSDHH